MSAQEGVWFGSGGVSASGSGGCLPLGLGVSASGSVGVHLQADNLLARYPLDRHPVGVHPILGRQPPAHCMLGYTPPRREFLTLACENITFPELLRRAVKIFSKSVDRNWIFYSAPKYSTLTCNSKKLFI